MDGRWTVPPLNVASASAFPADPGAPLQGEICSMPCPPGRFGPGCQGECRCHNGGQCDPHGGQCQCAPGFTGDWMASVWGWGGSQESPQLSVGLCQHLCPPCRCQERCPVGRYGQDCQESCDCANGGQCFHVDGGCLCEAGFQGSRCEERHCLPGLYGLHCESRCLSCTPSCHPMLGECVCLPGWAGLYCNESCPPGSFGPGCLHSCLCLHGGVCDGTTGHCHCPPGYTGSCLCNRSCDCAHGASCDPQSGTCHCPPGWQGPQCLQPCPVSPSGCAGAAGTGPSSLTVPAGPQCKQGCPHGSWGRGCLMSCSCRNGASCSPQDGSCTCAPGYRGPSCQRPCPAGRYGKRCSLSCSCANGSSCNPTNGSCLCSPGWRGPRCSQREWGAGGRGSKVPSIHMRGLEGARGNCPCHRGPCGRPWSLWLNGISHGANGTAVSPACAPGTFGLQCEQLCHCPHNATCDPTNGTCPCAPGTTGPRCEAGEESRRALHHRASPPCSLQPPGHGAEPGGPGGIAGGCGGHSPVLPSLAEGEAAAAPGCGLQSSRTDGHL
uniref:EGF-like domain-containing protein n=1 Tax=Catharus ustulatus TaxID=91951 RepID=A0A8C3Y2E7_CATUS